MRKFKKPQLDWIKQLDLLSQLYDGKPITNSIEISSKLVIDEKGIRDEVCEAGGRKPINDSVSTQEDGG